MNTGVLIIIVLTVTLVLLVVLPRVRGLARSEKTTVERRSGRERRRRTITVANDRRTRTRRAEDAAKAFVEKISQ
ncbi:MAG: hypothetical protein PVG53_12215 [Holophagae bacterium]|jgi:hypothetical protein